MAHFLTKFQKFCNFFLNLKVFWKFFQKNQIFQEKFKFSKNSNFQKKIIFCFKLLFFKKLYFQKIPFSKKKFKLALRGGRC